MKLKPIKNKTELKKALNRVDELDVLMLLVEKYEEEHYTIPPSDPIETIKFFNGAESFDTKRPGAVPWYKSSCF